MLFCRTDSACPGVRWSVDTMGGKRPRMWDGLLATQSPRRRRSSSQFQLFTYRLTRSLIHPPRNFLGKSFNFHSIFPSISIPGLLSQKCCLSLPRCECPKTFSTHAFSGHSSQVTRSSSRSELLFQSLSQSLIAHPSRRTQNNPESLGKKPKSIEPQEAARFPGLPLPGLQRQRNPSGQCFPAGFGPSHFTPDRTGAPRPSESVPRSSRGNGHAALAASTRPNHSFLGRD